MDAIIELTKIDFSSVFISVFIILIGIRAIVSVFEWIIDKLGLETKGMREKREEHNLLMKTSQNLTELQEQHTKDVEESDIHDERIRQDLTAFIGEMKNIVAETQDNIQQFAENRIHDREQSIQIQKELTDSQKKLSDSISAISQKIDIMQKSTDKRFYESEQKNNKRIRADLKDKISQLYRYYHSVGKINDMELEALEGLIESYELADGENSFIRLVKNTRDFSRGMN